MLTSRRIRFWRFIGPVLLIFGAVCLPPNLDAKAWINGHIVEMRPDGFLLQMRLYRIAVHTRGRYKSPVQEAVFVAHRSRSSGSSHG